MIQEWQSSRLYFQNEGKMWNLILLWYKNEKRQMAIEDLYFIELTIVNLLCLYITGPLYLCSCQAFFVVLSFNYTFH